ncbi:MAG TPA: hypothetical protein VHZ03_21480 [Trebonia sp.]|nr:hypothetical protein [Trebonia sp.]
MPPLGNGWILAVVRHTQLALGSGLSHRSWSIESIHADALTEAR